VGASPSREQLVCVFFLILPPPRVYPDSEACVPDGK
jgi:hypothetical protein